MTAAVLDAETLEKLISAAVAAPSLHDTQPWRYRLDPDTVGIHVRAAADRGLPFADPVGRGLHVSLGAAVFNLRVAVAHFGWEPVVRFLPRPADPALLATVRLAGPRPPGRRHHRPDLYDALWRRHSSRFPFTDQQVPQPVLAEIAEAAGAEGARLAFPDPPEVTRVLHLTAEAERCDAADRDRGQERRNLVREGAHDGLSGAVLGPYDAACRVPVGDFAGLCPGTRPRSAPTERHPVIGVLATAHDTPADWLRAGQGLQHALLVATAHHVRACLCRQAVERPDLRWALRDMRAGREHVQMLVRFGYGPAGPATPRRPARDVPDPDVPAWDVPDPDGMERARVDRG